MKTSRAEAEPTTASKSFLPTTPYRKATTSNPKRQISQQQHTMGSFISSLVAGVGSGALSSIICAPLDLLRTRMQVWGDVVPSKKEGALFFLRSIHQQEGWKGYFRGLGATLATVPLFWGLYFPIYDNFKTRFGRTHPDWNPSLIHCTAAIGAGCIADIICNPAFVVRTRLQTEALHRKGPATGILRTIQSLYAEGGVRIFWRGLAASLFGLSHVAIQFPVYEYLKSLARERRAADHNSISSKETTVVDLLLSSGLSKMMAATLTYPHEVLRSRMMDARVPAEAGLVPTFVRVWRREGVVGFYSGLHISLLRVIPNCVITFTTYELLLRWSKENILK